MNEWMFASEQISLFCRLQINTKKGLPIRSSEMGLLIYLVKTQESDTPNEIAKYFKVTKAMVTNMVTTLCKKGYLIKERNKLDQRSFHLIPTKLAISLVEETITEYFTTMELLERTMGKASFDQMIALIKTANEILLEDQTNE